jgi:hypothetical protein
MPSCHRSFRANFSRIGNCPAFWLVLCIGAALLRAIEDNKIDDAKDYGSQRAEDKRLASSTVTGCSVVPRLAVLSLLVRRMRAITEIVFSCEPKWAGAGAIFHTLKVIIPPAVE